MEKENLRPIGEKRNVSNLTMPTKRRATSEGFSLHHRHTRVERPISRSLFSQYNVPFPDRTSQVDLKREEISPIVIEDIPTMIDTKSLNSSAIFEGDNGIDNSSIFSIESSITNVLEDKSSNDKKLIDICDKEVHTLTCDEETELPSRYSETSTIFDNSIVNTSNICNIVNTSLIDEKTSITLPIPYSEIGYTSAICENKIVNDTLSICDNKKVNDTLSMCDNSKLLNASKVNEAIQCEDIRVCRSLTPRTPTRLKVFDRSAISCERNSQNNSSDYEELDKSSKSYEKEYNEIDDKLQNPYPTLEIPKGFTNIGNSCFLNAVIRSILSMQKLVDQITTYNLQIDENIGFDQPLNRKASNTRSLMKNLENIICYIEFECMNEKVLKQAIRQTWQLTQLDEYRQHDAHEFMLALFDMLPPCIENLFSIALHNKLVCCSCNNEVVTSDKTLDLSVSPVDKLSSIRDELPDHENGMKLSDCLKQAFKPEYVNDFKCVLCKHEGVMIKRRISNLPQFIIICLMRFDYKGEDDKPLIFPIKLKNRVIIPAELDLSPVCLSSIVNSKYSLRSIVSHHGCSSDFGHYICDAEINSPSLQLPSTSNDQQSNWFTFDDCDVRSKHISDILTDRQKSAYILFYEING